MGTTTATTDDYDTTFGTIQIFPFKEQRRILETDGESIGPYKTGKMGDASVTASSWRLVERGRVVLFKKGQYAGKLAAIAQIIDHRRVLVEGFSSDASKVVPRHAAPLAYVTLTGIVIPKSRSASVTLLCRSCGTTRRSRRSGPTARPPRRARSSCAEGSSTTLSASRSWF